MSRKKRHNLKQELSAYLDGELDEARRAEVEAYLLEDADAQQLVEELRQTAGMVKGLERKTAPEEMVDELMGKLERQALLGEEEEFLPPTRAFRMGRYLATAAVLLLTASVGVVVFQQQGYLKSSERPGEKKSRRVADRGRSDEGLDRSAQAKRSKPLGVVTEKAAERPPTLSELGERSEPADRALQRAPVREEQAADTLARAKVAEREELPSATPASPPAPKKSPPTAGVAKRDKSGGAEEKTVLIGDVATDTELSRRGTKLWAERDLAEGKSVTPDQILDVVVADASSQLRNARAAEAFFRTHKIEVVRMTFSTQPDTNQHKPRTPTKKDSQVSRHYLVRTDPSQMAAISSLFAGDADVVDVHLYPAHMGQVSPIDRSNAGKRSVGTMGRSTKEPARGIGANRAAHGTGQKGAVEALAQADVRMDQDRALPALKAAASAPAEQEMKREVKSLGYLSSAPARRVGRGMANRPVSLADEWARPTTRPGEPVTSPVSPAYQPVTQPAQTRAAGKPDGRVVILIRLQQADATTGAPASQPASRRSPSDR